MNYLPSIIPNSGLSSLLGKNGLATANFFNREILVLQCLVAGTSFRNIHKVESQLVPQTKFTLQREPENKHDELAIKVLLEDYLIGYIPRDSNEVVARLMDSGKKFQAVLAKIEWQGAWARVDVNVLMVD
ncbi:MAG: HIRAN domain-containing protein [Bacteroidetes bacterium]|nr:HIRAN domain-containing protein [Bacteroidota bacterium]